MSQIIPIYIPTYISNAEYAPARVLPRLLFFNGMVECQQYWFADNVYSAHALTSFPYFDNYSVVTGSFPTDASKSLLFNNEAVAYGTAPSSSLYSEYWDTYISLLYNPKTRLVNCSAIIPLADYVKIELNDIVNFRGAYFHLRAINDYSLKDGTCQLQLLGPIIPDTFSRLQPTPEPPSGGYAEVSWSFTESGADGNFKIYDNGSPVVTATTTTSGNLRVSQSHAINTEMYPVSWTAGTSMSLNVNGGATIATAASTDTTITASFTAQSGSVYYVTGSILYTSSCCTPTITSITASGGNTIDIYFTTGSGCGGCTATTIQSSINEITWGGNNTAGCNSPRTITAPTASTYYRMYETCNLETSSFSNSVLFTTSSAGTADLDWSFSITGGPTATMDLYVNDIVVETRTTTSNGNYNVLEGDVIKVEINVSGCSGGSIKANAYTTGIIVDAACQNNVVGLITTTYTVQPGDIGNTLTLDIFGSCDGGCV